MANPASGDWGVIGHGGAVRLLSGAMNAGRLAHAYLITGAEQVGRKTLALALARAVSCEAEFQRPCGSCRQCDRIARGIHADVRVIERHTPIRGTAGGEASDEGQDERHARFSIEHIREMQRDATLNAFEGPRQVFILDGAETLRFQDGPATEAANALLKTLEEPPGDVLLVLIAPSRAASFSPTPASEITPMTTSTACSETSTQGRENARAAEPQSRHPPAIPVPQLKCGSTRPVRPFRICGQISRNPVRPLRSNSFRGGAIIL